MVLKGPFDAENWTPASYMQSIHSALWAVSLVPFRRFYCIVFGNKSIFSSTVTISVEIEILIKKFVCVCMCARARMHVREHTCLTPPPTPTTSSHLPSLVIFLQWLRVAHAPGCSAWTLLAVVFTGACALGCRVKEDHHYDRLWLRCSLEVTTYSLTWVQKLYRPLLSHVLSCGTYLSVVSSPIVVLTYNWL